LKKTFLNKTDKLPLTCSRKGTCCFGKAVFINPFELLYLANAKNITISNFINENCEPGGIQLKFDGSKDKKGQHACSLYVDNFGCSIHTGRPLACRLYPIGRQIQNNKHQYIFEGTTFPCLTDCKEVLNLPQLTVEEYLNGQETELFENAQDGYLEVMQNMADISFTLLLEKDLFVKINRKIIKYINLTIIHYMCMSDRDECC
jgi:Fe-S-cluster containining protein